MSASLIYLPTDKNIVRLRSYFQRLENFFLAARSSSVEFNSLESKKVFHHPFLLVLWSDDYWEPENKPAHTVYIHLMDPNYCLYTYLTDMDWETDIADSYYIEKSAVGKATLAWWHSSRRLRRRLSRRGHRLTIVNFYTKQTQTKAFIEIITTTSLLLGNSTRYTERLDLFNRKRKVIF